MSQKNNQLQKSGNGLMTMALGLTVKMCGFITYTDTENYHPVLAFGRIASAQNLVLDLSSEIISMNPSC